MYAGPPPPHYAMLENGQGYGNVGQPSPYNRNVPRYPPKHHKNSCGGSCCRCICCCCCFLVFLNIILVISSLYIYHIYDPKIPTYKVENLEVKSLDVDQRDLSLNTEFLVTVRADNPNRNIGFIYGEDSSVDVTYNDTSLCNGKVPSFYQGHENTTFVKVDLKGKSEFGSSLQQAFTNSTNNHKIPLLVKIKVPVSIMLGEIPLREFKVFVNCSLLVNNLSPNTTVGIISRDTKINIEF